MHRVQSQMKAIKLLNFSTPFTEPSQGEIRVGAGRGLGRKKVLGWGLLTPAEGRIFFLLITFGQLPSLLLWPQSLHRSWL